MKILLDVMGGDNAPNAVLQGAADAVKEFGQGMTIGLPGPGRGHPQGRCRAEHRPCAF